MWRPESRPSLVRKPPANGLYQRIGIQPDRQNDCRSHGELHRGFPPLPARRRRLARFHSTCQRIVTWLKLPFRQRRTIRFHPLFGLGASATPTPLGSTSIDTGIPGRMPCTRPLLALPPSMVTTECLSRDPVHTITPDDERGVTGGACVAATVMLCVGVACCVSGTACVATAGCDADGRDVGAR